MLDDKTIVEFLYPLEGLENKTFTTYSLNTYLAVEKYLVKPDGYLYCRSYEMVENPAFNDFDFNSLYARDQKGEALVTNRDAIPERMLKTDVITENVVHSPAFVVLTGPDVQYMAQFKKGKLVSLRKYLGSEGDPLNPELPNKLGPELLTPPAPPEGPVSTDLTLVLTGLADMEGIYVSERHIQSYRYCPFCNEQWAGDDDETYEPAGDDKRIGRGAIETPRLRLPGSHRPR
jgi:hypothetical protein